MADTDPAGRSPSVPPPQYLPAEHILGEIAEHGSQRLRSLSWLQILVLASVAGGLITVGALLSVLLAAGIDARGPARLVEGLGFSAGFFFVILTHAVLFTEANVVLPTTLLVDRPSRCGLRLLRFWALAWVGNLLGAAVVGGLLVAAGAVDPRTVALLAETIEGKMVFAAEGTPAAWGRAVLSGVMANWLVGLAAFFAVMGRTIIGKFVPVLLAVTAFVSAGLQHSPANMGFFSLAAPAGEGPGWAMALAWNIVPAGIGNIVGGAFLVALPLWYALGRATEPAR